MNTPVSQTPEFQAKWTALQQQLAVVRSIADMHNPSPTRVMEAISIAWYFLDGVSKFMLNPEEDHSNQEAQP